MPVKDPGGVWYCPTCKKPCSYKVLTCSNCTDSADPVKSPSHYTDGPVPGIECIDVAKHFNFALGNVIKYVWRCDYKGKPLEDLEKAAQYLQFEMERRRAKD